MQNEVLYFIKNQVKNYPIAKKFIDDLTLYGNCFFIGGVLRSFKNFDIFNEIKDIDIIFQSENPITLSKICNKYNYSKNHFGGFKINCDGIMIDVWNIEDTWAFRTNTVVCEKYEMPKLLCNTTFLNIDSIVYDLHNDTWYDTLYKQAMTSKTLDIVLETNPYLKSNLQRAINFSKKYTFVCSQKLKNMALEHGIFTLE